MYPARRLPLLSLLLLTLLWIATRDAAAAPPPDTHFDRVVKAYRRELNAEERLRLEEEDPAPTLYADARLPAEHDLTRLFASLPDAIHLRLRTEGYLKWKVTALPPAQQACLRAAAKQWEARGYGPFPLSGNRASHTGFARIRIPGLPGEVYSWWLAAPDKDARPVWVTLVRALGLGTQEQEEAHRLQLPVWIAQPETAPIGAQEWRTLPPVVEVPREAAPEGMEDTFVRDLLRLYRSELRREVRQKWLAEDPLLARRLESRDPADVGLNQFVVRLADRDRRSLETHGRAVWRMDQLPRERRKLLAPLLARLNRELAANGQTGARFSAEPFEGTTVGISRVEVPGEPRPVLTWWARAPGVPGPTWISLNNQHAIKNPAYYRVHLEQLGEG